MDTYIAALDQGTTSSRAILFHETGEIAARAQYPFRQIYPQPGWVEHDPMEIWASERRALAEITSHIDPRQVAAIGITNQRETTILWDRRTGEPIHNAIVWQCRRTAPFCDELKARGLGRSSRRRRACSSTPTSPPARSAGSWITSPAPGSGRSGGSSASARWIPGSSGSSAAAPST